MPTKTQASAMPEGAGATVLLGDWTPLVRDPVDLVRLSYLAGALYCLLIGESGTAVRFVLTFVAVLLPRFLGAPRLFDAFFSVTLGLQAWGNLLGLFGQGTVFDRFDHFLSPVGVAPLFYLWLIRLDLVPDLREEATRFSWVGILLVGFSIGATVGVLYEIYEYVDNQLGGDLFTSYSDTIWDLIMDSLGALAGSTVLAVWARAGWGSERCARPHRQAGTPTAAAGSG